MCRDGKRGRVFLPDHHIAFLSAVTAGVPPSGYSLFVEAIPVRFARKRIDRFVPARCGEWFFLDSPVIQKVVAP